MQRSDDARVRNEFARARKAKRARKEGGTRVRRRDARFIYFDATRDDGGSGAYEEKKRADAREKRGDLVRVVSLHRETSQGTRRKPPRTSALAVDRVSRPGPFTVWLIVRIPGVSYRAKSIISGVACVGKTHSSELEARRVFPGDAVGLEKTRISDS